MKSNISIGEGVIRIVLGVLFASIFAGLFTGWIAMIGLLALYPVVTGLGGWDPIFGALKKHTSEQSPYEDELPTSEATKTIHAPSSEMDVAA